MNDITKYAVYEFMFAVNERDFDRLEEILHDEAEFHFPKTRPILGKKSITRFFNILFRKFTSLGWTMDRVIIDEHQAAVTWKNEGESGDQSVYENYGVTVFEVKDGKLIFISDYFKDTGKF